MDRRLLFPAIAVTAWAQQVSPEAAAAEKAVRARVEKFLQLEVDKNYRAAWALVADDTQDYFFDSGKPNISSFVIEKIELSDNNTRARVTFRVKGIVRAAALADQEFEFPAFSTWKLENGDWFWYVDQSTVDTPFGTVVTSKGPPGGAARAAPVIPDLAKLRAQVTISGRKVSLDESAPVQSVTISNGMSGPIGLTVSPDKIEGVSVELEKTQLKAGEAGQVRFRLTASAKVSGVVRVVCSPLGNEFDIQVMAN